MSKPKALPGKHSPRKPRAAVVVEQTMLRQNELLDNATETLRNATQQLAQVMVMLPDANIEWAGGTDLLDMLLGQCAGMCHQMATLLDSVEVHESDDSDYDNMARVTRP